MNEQPAFLDFDVDRSILADLVFSQNGNIQSGIRELVMNAFDAGSPRCEITIGPNTFEVLDYGVGFEDEASIHKFFKTFGTPHKDGDAKYGRFRIGRGQIMAFGKITWHSKTFAMSTDIKAKGMGFHLRTDSETYIAGCKVSGEFYEAISSDQLNSIKNEIAELVKYTEQDVFVNGLQVNESSTEWDYEDDDLKIKWDPRDGFCPKIYSLGVFVRSLGAYEYGVDAHIVTKVPLSLNMARNDINQSDPVYQKIKRILRQRMVETSADSWSYSGVAGLPESTRVSIIRQLLERSIKADEIFNLPLIRDYRGHKIRLSALINDLSSGMPIFVAPEPGNLICDRLATTKAARVLHPDELRVWQRPSIRSLIDTWCNLIMCTSHKNNFDLMSQLSGANVTSYEEISVTIDERYETLRPADLNIKERIGRKTLYHVSKFMAKHISKLTNTSVPARKISIGESEVADAWTDGATYICIARHMLNKLPDGPSGAYALVSLLLHEYCHDASSAGSHEHGFEFYEKYHELSSADLVGEASLILSKRFACELCNNGLPIPESIKKHYEEPYTRIEVRYSYDWHRFNRLSWSPLAKIILSAFGAQIESKASTIVFPMLKSFNTCLASGIRMLANDVGLKDEDVARKLQSNNREKLHRTIWDEYLDSLDEFGFRWVKSTGSDENAFREFINLGRNTLSYQSKLNFDVFLDLLNLLCLDSGNSVHMFTCTNGRYKHHPLFIGEKIKYQHSHATFSRLLDAGNKSERFNFTIDIIKNLINSIVDERERKEFISLYLNANLGVELD